MNLSPDLTIKPSVTWLVTGGCGFIGSNFVRLVLATRPDIRVVNFDALTYAGNLANLADIAPAAEASGRYRFVRGDIASDVDVQAVMADEKPDLVVNFAAETHVDRSIMGAKPFIQTNIAGVQTLLDAVRVQVKAGQVTRFVQVSTDEVFGSIEPPAFVDESAPFNPSSPYAASKAAAEHLIAAARTTHGLDTVVTRCGNNYGPYQFPEKFVPLIMTRALEGREIPVYGDGQQVRDWIHVADHARGILLACEKGVSGRSYDFATGELLPNLEVVRRILAALGKPESLVKHVTDRPGHDRRYAMSATRAREELGWQPDVRFGPGLLAALDWYKGNEAWWRPIVTGEYRHYYEQWYRDTLKV